VQIASVLRAKIVNGEWAKGAQLPTIQTLCQQYRVARVTVRQALQLLTRERMVASHRGKGTFVTYERDRERTAGLSQSINDALVTLPDHKIKVIGRERNVQLPPGFDFHEPLFDKYVRVRKVHWQGGAPYSLMDLYVAEAAYDRIPKGADAREKMVKLLLKHWPAGITAARQVVTVGNADLEASQLLEYPMAAAVAYVSRVLCDGEGKVLCYGAFTYRGDSFLLEMNNDSYIRQTW
jgi:GntR family transcriptional regulator